MSKIEAQEIKKAVEEGRAKLVGRVGLQRRPVYEIDGVLYEQAIHFDDGQDHSHFYQRTPEEAIRLREMLA